MEVEADDQQEISGEPIEIDNPDEVQNNEIYSIKYIEINEKPFILSGGGDDRALLWDLTEGVQIELSHHKDSVIQVEYLISKKDNTLFLIIASLDGIVKIFVKQTEFSLLHKLEGPSEIEFISLHKTEDVILVGSSDGMTWIWEIRSGECLNVLSSHESNVTCGCFTPNGKRILTSSSDGSTKVWSPNQNLSSSLIHTFKGSEWHTAPIVSMCCLKALGTEPPIVATGSQNGFICLAKLDDKKVLKKLKHVNGNVSDGFCSVEGLAFCSSESEMGSLLLVSGATDGFFIVWNWKEGVIRQRLQLPNVSASITKLFFLPNSFEFFVTSTSGDIILADARKSNVEKHTLINELILDMIIVNDRIYTAVETGIRAFNLHSFEELK